jgi:peptide deformylase
VAVRNILLLGDPELLRTCTEVQQNELDQIKPIIRDLFDTMAQFQADHGWGRAIAASQIGEHRRIVCMRVDKEIAMINPVISHHSKERITVWEDCMSFPDLLVKLSNPRRCRLIYRDEQWQQHMVELEDDYAELLQHEVDHLDGVLAVQRAIDGQSFALRQTMPEKSLELKGGFREITNVTG